MQTELATQMTPKPVGTKANPRTGWSVAGDGWRWMVAEHMHCGGEIHDAPAKGFYQSGLAPDLEKKKFWADFFFCTGAEAPVSDCHFIDKFLQAPNSQCLKGMYWSRLWLLAHHHCSISVHTNKLPSGTVFSVASKAFDPHLEALFSGSVSINISPE